MQPFSYVSVCPVAVRRLNEAGLPVIVATNQSGVGRGYFPESLVHTVNRVMTQTTRRGGREDRCDLLFVLTLLPKTVAAASQKPACWSAQRGSTGSMCSAPSSLVIVMVTWNWREMPAREVSSCALATAKVNSPGMRRSGAWQPDFVAEDLAQAADWNSEATR